MNMIFRRKKFKGNFIDIYETPRVILGFTELGFSFADLSQWFDPYGLVELKQVHSDIVRFSSQTRDGTEGDGIILDQKGMVAVIKTADCSPLFFWGR
jgi:copper oxidase (laccase) domain-containing protein